MLETGGDAALAHASALDRALDHLNRIDRWVAWRRVGVVPAPTDGWASSVVTLHDDRLPIDARDLDARLWRIDQAVRLLGQRARGLSRAELDWLPPGGGWPLRRVLYRVARSELFYAGSLGDALPGDPRAAYAEASRRLDERIRAVPAGADDRSVLHADLYGALVTRGRPFRTC